MMAARNPAHPYSLSLLDALAQIAYGREYDGRYTTAPGDAHATREALRRRRLDLMYFATSRLPGSCVAPAWNEETQAEIGQRAYLVPARAAVGAADSRSVRIAALPAVAVPASKQQRDLDDVAARIRAARQRHDQQWHDAEENLLARLVSGTIRALDQDARPVLPESWHGLGVWQCTRLGYRVLSADFLKALAAEKQRNRPPQHAVDAWTLAQYQDARDANRPPPKRESVIGDGIAQLNATDKQMRAALQTVPDHLKRRRGVTDWKIRHDNRAT